ncbi:MAG: MarR family transcriptional regulator, partial [Holophagales bacterium]|nr:MarR family transcriptional regulator [Holophagales bacterium]
LKPLGLTYPQYTTLTLLWEEDGQGVGALASRLGMKSSTLTPLAKRLEELGYVERRRDDADERRVLVYLTESGRSLQADSREVVRCIVEAVDLDGETLEGLIKTLDQLGDDLARGA